MSKVTIIERTKQKAVDNSAHKQSFIGRNLWLFYVVCFLVYPIAAMISAVTEGANIYLRLSTAWGYPTLAMIATVLIAGMIEVLVFMTGKGIVDDLQERVFSEGGPALRIFIVKCFIFIGVFGYSISQSLSGAPLLDNTVREQTDPVAAKLVSKDSIRAQYAELMAPHRLNIDAARNTKWKGSVTRDAMRAIHKEQDQIALLMGQQDEELKAADMENAMIREEYENDLAASASWAGNLAGVGQSVCLACLIFIGLFDDGVREEANIRNGSNSTPPTPSASSAHPQQIGFGQVPAPSANQQASTVPAPSPRRPIGFHGPAQQVASAHVATCSYSPKKTKREAQLSADTHLAAYRRFTADLKANESHLQNGHGDPETVGKRIQALQEKVKYQEDELAVLGLKVVQVNKIYKLEEIG